MSFLQFTKNGQLHTDKLGGDNDLNIFNQDLTNVYLDKYDELINQRVTYDDIERMYLLKNNDVIHRLPNSLKYLYIKSATLRQLPISDIVAQNIEVISLDFTNLNTFPNISKCVNLKELTINHSNLQVVEINYLLPPNLQVLNLRYNNIYNIDFTIFKTHPKLKLNLSYNCLSNENIDDILLVNNKADIKMQNRYIHKTITNQNYNDIEIRNLMNANLHQNNERRQNRENNNNDINNVASNVLASNTQTVHLSSINKTIKTSYNNIIKYINTNNLREKKDNLTRSFFADCIYSIWDSNSIIVNEIIYEFKRNNLETTRCLAFLNEKKGDINKHSLIKLSYMELLSDVWTVIYTHSQKINLIERLHTEIVDSIGMCFTGCVNRLINVLVGYIDGVIVSISLKEEIQMSIQQLMDKLNTHQITYKQTKEEMIQILNQDYEVDASDSNNVISIEYKNSWLSALQDYRPISILCKFNKKVKEYDNDDKIKAYYYISYDDLIYDSEQNFDEEEKPIGKITEQDNCVAKIYSYKSLDETIIYPEKFLNYMLV